ncbi:MAG: MFS transporter [Proteobacteria bacterium]|nr:MFS transporter [Pseudomonadota bacterium]
MANAAARVEIQDLIDSRPLSGTQIFVIVVCALSVVFDGFDLQVMALTVPALSQAWGLPPPQFSAALSASLFGMGLGAAFLAPLGDRYGRRAMLVLSLIAVGIGALACAGAQNVTQLAVFRFITGIGLGVSMPNAIALTADYAPRARRSALVTAMYCNTATGALVAGLSAPWIVARLGWQGPFLVGGVLPIAAALLLLVTPESLKFLLHRRPGHASIARILRRIAPAVDPATVYVAPPPDVSSGGMRDLFAPSYRLRTLWLWLAFAMNAFILYLLVSWLPTLLLAAGWSASQAQQAVAFNQAGGILGGLLLAWLMDRLGGERILLVGFLVSAASLLLFLVAPSGFWTWGALLLVIGACIGGAQFALPSLGTRYYPAAILSTGTGWGSAAARVGAFVAPLLGGALMAGGMTTQNLLTLLALPALVAAVAMVGLSKAGK